MCAELFISMVFVKIAACFCSLGSLCLFLVNLFGSDCDASLLIAPGKCHICNVYGRETGISLVYHNMHGCVLHIIASKVMVIT